MTKSTRRLAVITALVSCAFLALLAQGFIPSGTFTPDAPLIAARQGAATAVLPDGSILVTGGLDGSGNPLASAEFLGSGNSAGTMTTARSGHIAVALADGRVLVAGGFGPGGAVTNTAEIYSSGAWTLGASMLAARGGATATLLQDGRVFIAGGQGSGGALQTTEVFDPSTGQFSNGAPMSSVRMNHAAALLRDGRVVIAGGTDGNSALASIDIFDPTSGSMTPSGAMTIPRAGLSATTLVTGTVLFAGGASPNGVEASTEIFDPAAMAVTPGPAMSVPRSGHSALLLPNNNTVLMAGGTASSAAAEIFVSWQNAFLPFGTLSSARTGAAAAAEGIGGTAHVAGGLDASGAISAAADKVRFPMVKSDKPDYQPGDTATITGSGFGAGETVSLSYLEIPDTDGDSPIQHTVPADMTGAFTDTLPINAADANIRFYLSVTGQTSGLTAGMTFTDAPQVHFVTSSFTISPSTCSPAIVIQTPGVNSEQIGLSTSPAGGTFYSDALCATPITTVTTSANNPARTTFFFKDANAGAVQILLSDNGPALRFSQGSQIEAISNTAVATSLSLGVSPSSVQFNFSTTVTLTGTLKRTSDGTGVSGASIDFIFDGVDLGTSATNTSGVATKTFDPANFPFPPPAPLPAGTYLATAEFLGGAVGPTTYAGSSNSQNFTVTGAAPAITSATSATFTVGTAATPFSVTTTGTPAPALSESGAMPSGVSFVDNGNGTATISGTPALGTVADYPITITANNGVTPNATQAFTLHIAKAAATINVTAYSLPYDGNSHTATGTATGLGGADLSSDLDLGHTTHTSAGTYTSDYWAFTDPAGNYNNVTATTITDVITQVALTINVSAANTTYTGLPYAGATTCTATGVNSESPATTAVYEDSTHTALGGPPTNAGSYFLKCSAGGTGTNYVANFKETSFTIGLATPTINVTAAGTTYTGLPYAGATTCTATGVNSESPATTAVYEDSTHTALGGPPTNAGSYFLKCSAGGTGTNYVASSQEAPFTIAQATLTINVSAAGTTYTGLPYAGATTCSATGVNSESPSATPVFEDSTHTALAGPPTNAGSYYLKCSAGGTGTNYIAASQEAPFTIAQATLTINVSAAGTTYTGLPYAGATTCSATGVHSETPSATPVFEDSTHTALAGPPTNAGSYYLKCSAGGTGTNYTAASQEAPFTIAQAILTINVSAAGTTYTGLPYAGATTCSATGVNSESPSATPVYEDSTHTALAGPPTNAGSYYLKCSAGGTGTNYVANSQEAPFTIAQATLTINVSAAGTTYTGLPYAGATTCSATGVHSETPSATPVFEDSTHTALAGPPTNAGSYYLKCSAGGTGTNYIAASQEAAFAIAQAAPSVTATGNTCTYNGSACAGSGSAKGVLNESLAPVTLSYSGSDHNGGAYGPTSAAPANAGSYTVTASFGGNSNYTPGSSMAAVTINQATSTTTVTGGSFTYDGGAHAAMVLVAGAGGLSLNPTPTYSGSCSSAPVTVAQGSSCTASYTFAGDLNHTGSNGSASVTIIARIVSVSSTNNGKYWGQSDPNPLTIASLTNFVGSDNVTASFSRAAGEAVGTYHITATLSPIGALANYTITNPGATFTIYADTTSLSVDTSGYSFIVYDCAHDTLKATLMNTVFGTPVSGASLIFTITSSASGNPSQTVTGTTNASGVATVSLPLSLPVGPATFTVNFAGNSTLAGTTSTLSPAPAILANPNVTPGVNASTLYSGSRFFWTTSSTSSTATLTLSATIRDDAFCTGIGDITTANVSFLISTDNGVTFGPVSNGQTLPVGLVNPADKSTGTASVISQFNLGKNLSQQLWVRVSVGGKYAFSADTYDVPITIAVPGQTNTLIAGGSLNNDGSSLAGGAGYPASGYLGTAATAADSVDFGGMVAYTSKKTNPSGQLTVTIHSYNKPDGTVDTVPHTYYVKSNSIASMTSSGLNSLSFSAKQNVYELTNGGKTGLDGGGVMQFTATKPGGTYQLTNQQTGASVTLTCPGPDAQHPNPQPCLSVVVFKSTGGVWFSSAWGPVVSGDLPQTIEKVMITSSGTITF